MCWARLGAPPWRGPERAPIAPERHAAASAPVEAMTRAVNVEAFMPCSAAEMKYASMASTCLGSGSPRQRIMKRSAMVRPLSTSLCGTIGLLWPWADWPMNEMAMTEARARLSRTSASSMSRSGLNPHTGASWASADCTSTRMSPECTGSGNGSAGGSPGSNSLSTSSPQTWPKETRPTRSLRSTPR